MVEIDINEAETPKNKITLYDDEGRKKSQATLLIEIGGQYELFHNENMDAFAEVDRNTVYPIGSKSFKDLLGHEFFKLTGKGCNANSMKAAADTLEAIAKHDGQRHGVYKRIFSDGEKILIDLCDKERRIAIVDKSGWRIEDKSGVKFVCKRGMTALPVPDSAGNIGLLREYLNISDEEMPLVIGWMVCAIGFVMPYPILVLQGEQGSGKSTVSRVIRALVDPSSVPLRSPPREVKDLLVSAANNHIVALDNLSGLSPEMSDCLCRMSTGGGHDVRQLFTDTDQILIELQRPVIVNGIDDIATRPDLAERAFIINLPEIKSKDRRTENEFWRGFEQDKPAIFAGLLDSLINGLVNKNNVVLKEKPRMADAAIWATACEYKTKPKHTFAEAHAKNQAEAIELGIEASPVGTAIMAHMEGISEWKGTPTALLNELSKTAGENQTRSKAWPQSTKGLKNAIKRLSPNFRRLGIIIEQKSNDNREYSIVKVKAAKQPPYPPETPEATTGAAFRAGGYQADREAQADSCSNRRNENPIRLTENITNSTTKAFQADKNPQSHYDKGEI